MIWDSVRILRLCRRLSTMTTAAMEDDATRRHSARGAAPHAAALQRCSARRRASRHRGTCDTKSLLMKDRFQVTIFGL
jgi:hypothetical protein